MGRKTKSVLGLLCRIIVCLCCLFALTATAGPASPAGGEASGMISDAPVEGHVDPMWRKFFRGVVNVVTGRGEIPRQLGIHASREGVWKGVPLGLLSGVIMSVVRTGTGVVDTVAFMVPAPGYL